MATLFSHHSTNLLPYCFEINVKKTEQTNQMCYLTLSINNNQLTICHKRHAI